MLLNAFARKWANVSFSLSSTVRMYFIYVQYLYLAFKIQNMSSWNQKIMNVQYFSKLHILTRIVNCIRTRYNFIACFAESSVWLSLIVSKDLRSSNISWITQFNRLKRDINPNFQHRQVDDNRAKFTCLYSFY